MVPVHMPRLMLNSTSRCLLVCLVLDIDVHGNIDFQGGSTGLVVMGRYSCSQGRGFESKHRILDGHFFTYQK